MVRIAFIGVLLIGALSCTEVHEREGLHFTLLPAASTGIDFTNLVTEGDHPGSGIGVGDFNRDGLPDLFFAGEQAGSRLYVNKGELHFEDITQKAGILTTGGCTGVSVVDINNDGWPDIYVCIAAGAAGSRRRNLLFINQHDLTFKEEAEAYGLADSGYSMQAVFFDYDRDGRPDMYLVNRGADKLFRNDGIKAGEDHPVFREVSKQAGIVEEGNGTGVAVGDLNGDGYADIYVCNEDINNDLLWMNNGNGTFTNRIGTVIRHESHSSMGIDVADCNNDGLADIVTTDEQAGVNGPKEMMHSIAAEQRHQLELDKGYEQQYNRPMLQLNNGARRTGGFAEPFFSEIGQMAGVGDAEGASSVLMADLDNDGRKDLYLNHLFRNEGGLHFEDISESAGITVAGAPHGAVYADLDNDGDLDLVANNRNGPVLVFRNDSPHGNWLTVVAEGDSLNRDGIGAIVTAYVRGQEQTVAEYPVRGYLSSVDSRLHLGFGLGVPDSLRIVWPDNRQQVIVRPLPNRVTTVRHADAPGLDPAAPAAEPLFVDMTHALGIDFQHKETFFFDYQFQPSILQKYSQEGPFLSTGDLNGDGLEDVFIGGAFKQSGRVYLQNRDGSFTGKDLVSGNKYEEDMQSVLFDANGDGRPDLLVVGGSSEFDDHSSFYRPRLYLNDGRGGLRPDSEDIPAAMRTPAKCLAVADIDGDGDKDVFVGGRVSLGAYPSGAASYLLRNDHGRFSDVTAQVCPALAHAGMLNSAVFADIDGDGRPDLILAGDWMPIRIFHNDGKVFTEITGESGLGELPGCWRSLLVADVDHDGHPDIVAGNLGLNNPFHMGASLPAGLECKEMRSGYFENDGHGRFHFRPFPMEAQIAPVNTLCMADVDGDGVEDIVLAGNEYQASMVSGRYDASYGLVLKGDGHGGFRALRPADDGLILDGDVKDMKIIRVGGRRVLLTAINDRALCAFSLVK